MVFSSSIVVVNNHLFPHEWQCSIYKQDKMSKLSFRCSFDTGFMTAIIEMLVLGCNPSHLCYNITNSNSKINFKKRYEMFQLFHTILWPIPCCSKQYLKALTFPKCCAWTGNVYFSPGQGPRARGRTQEEDLLSRIAESTLLSIQTASTMTNFHKCNGVMASCALQFFIPHAI